MKHKILISAFSFLPNRGSEPGVGWTWAIEAARTQEVYVLTRTKCKIKIEDELAKNPVPNLHILYCDSSLKLREISIYLEYIHWQREAYLFLKKFLKINTFDYLIHLTFGNVFLPIWTHKLNVPFIWGPLGGGESVPRKFYNRFPINEKIPHIIKNLLIMSSKINPFLIFPAKKAILILCKTNDTKKVFPIRFHNKIQIKLETFFYKEKINQYFNINSNIQSENLNLVYTGRLVAFKNIEMLIDSLKDIIPVYPSLKMHIIGDGNQEEYLRLKAISYGLDKNIKFYGMITREEVLEKVSNSDIYVFPSYREGGSWSLMEAMALGKPVVCLKRTAMEVITDDSCAIRIEDKDYHDMVNDFSNAIKTLIKEPDLRKKMGENARKRIFEVYSNDSIANYIDGTLEQLDGIKKVYLKRK